jgi:hypothetical protein
MGVFAPVVRVFGVTGIPTGSQRGSRPKYPFLPLKWIELRDFWAHHTRDAPSGSQASSTGHATCRNRWFRRVDAKVCPSMVRQQGTPVEVTIFWRGYCVTSIAWAWAMMPISHYVRLMLSHGVQMCSFFSMICCERLGNAPRHECRLRQVSHEYWLPWLWWAIGTVPIRFRDQNSRDPNLHFWVKNGYFLGLWGDIPKVCAIRRTQQQKASFTYR